MIVAFNCASEELWIGLAKDDGTPISEFRAKPESGERGIHDKLLAKETERLLKEHGSGSGTRGSGSGKFNGGAVPDLFRIGVIIGPGSFTGLRIALAFAKGLVAARDIPVVALGIHEVYRQQLMVELSRDKLDQTILISSGYKPGTVYYSTARNPNELSIVTGAELAAKAGTLIVGDIQSLTQIGVGREHPEANPHYKELRFDTSVFLKMIAQSESLYSGEELDTLEPLYVIPFETGASGGRYNLQSETKSGTFL